MARKKISTKIVIKKELKKVFNKTVEVPDGLITNDTIRQTFFNYLKQSSYIPSSALATLWKLIDKQVIVPVNVKKSGFLSFLSKKLKNNTVIPFSYYKNVMGFYSGNSNRIYILIDNIKSLYPRTAADSISKTLTHELQHMQCCNFPHEFYNLHKDEFEKFYYTFFNILADEYGAPSEVDVDRNASTFFCKTILYMFDHLLSDPGSAIYNSDLHMYFDRCAHVYSKEKNSKSAIKCINDLSNCVTSGAIGILNGKYWDALERNSNSPHRLCYISLYKTYDRLYNGAKKYASAFGQELVFPSELISVLSQEDPSSKMYAFINRF